MTAVGRNDPCPCGSGLKFKKCCLKKAGPTVKSYSSGERDSALGKLMRFAARPEFEEDREIAEELFWGDRLSEEPDEKAKEVMDSEACEIAYNSWFAFDYQGDRERTVLDLFLERQGKNLTPGELKYLEGVRGSHLRLYEVIEVKPDEGMEVRDLWEDKRLWVRERLASRQIVAWDLIAARIGPGEQGDVVFETLPYVYPAASKEDILKDLSRGHRTFQRRFPGQDLSSFFKWMGVAFHQWWLQEVALRPLPKIMTAEGDPFIFAKVVFEASDRGAVIRALANHSNLADHGDGSYGWLENQGAFQRSLGTFVLEDDRLMFETTSRQRAERGKEFLQRLLGEAVRFRVITYEDVGQALKRAPGPAKNEMPDIPPEVLAELLGRFYEEHYHKWVDQPLPALGNRTPRYAARLKTVRPKLIALLKDMESRAERDRRAGRPAYDISWMWQELGLTRG